MLRGQTTTGTNIIDPYATLVINQLLAHHLTGYEDDNEDYRRLKSADF